MGVNMENIPDLKTVLQAIQALYHNQDASGKEKASTWLFQLQTSVFAWKVSDQLLLEKHNIESCYFAAQTMRSKIQMSFHELPEEAHTSLRDSLINHISNLNDNDNTVIATQLCLALADLALQMPSWKNVPQDLIERFASNSKSLTNLLEILTVLPEEINSRSLRLGENRRREITEELSANFPFLFQFLNCDNVISVSERLLSKVFRCLGSWLSLHRIQSSIIVPSRILVSLFQTLINVDSSSFLHESAADCVCAALLLIEDLDSHTPLAKALIMGVYPLQAAYEITVAREESDKSHNLCRVFTELAESLLDKLIETPGTDYGDFRALDLLLACVVNPDYDLAEITFNFWYRLSEALYQNNDDNLNALFRSYIERLITALCHHCCLEPDLAGVPDEYDEFGGFRSKVSELIKDVVFIVGSKHCFNQMFQNLKNQSQSSSWEYTEAALFVMTAVAKNVLPQEDEVVPHIVDALLALPESNTHFAVRYTSTQLLGELCEWIDSHPLYLEPILNHLMKCLQHSSLGTVAANALQKICGACRDHMANHFGGLVQIMQALDSLNISHEAAVGLFKGTTLILSKMPLESISDGMKQLCWIQVTALVQLLDGNIPVHPLKKSDPVIWLDRLSAIFRNTNPLVPEGHTHPGRPVVEEVWPVLSSICTKYQADVRVIERCCRCIRFAIRCVGKQSASLLQPLVQQIVALYQVHPHSCFLYLGSILVDEFGSDSGCIQGLLDMLTAFSVPTFQLLEAENGLKNHPDTVDDLFRLCVRFIQRSAIAFLQCSVINHIISCALVACSLDHKDANSSVISFFRELIKSSRIKEDDENFPVRQKLTTQLLNEHGQMLVNNLVQAQIFCLPSYMIPDIAEVLMELMLVDRPSVCRWLEVALKTLPAHRAGDAANASNEQLAETHRNITRAENGKSISTALREFSRLYR